MTILPMLPLRPACKFSFGAWHSDAVRGHPHHQFELTPVRTGDRLDFPQVYRPLGRMPSSAPGL